MFSRTDPISLREGEAVGGEGGGVEVLQESIKFLTKIFVKK